MSTRYISVSAVILITTAVLLVIPQEEMETIDGLASTQSEHDNTIYLSERVSAVILITTAVLLVIPLEEMETIDGLA
ncbi:hypothetical protein J6590_045747 [Homalodisca vitripennis]|nr:hypothetical protein J6590_045747 [Homalodisca vitripennis]